MRARRDTKRKRPTIFLHIVSQMNTGTVSKATVNKSCQRHDAAHTGLSERIGSISNWANFPSAQLLYDSILFWTPCTCSLRPSAWFQTRQRWRHAAPSSARRWTPAGQSAAVVWSARPSLSVTATAASGQRTSLGWEQPCLSALFLNTFCINRGHT